MTCTECLYHNQCYQEECYKQMRSICIDFTNAKQFHFSNLTNKIEGANVREGDYIESVSFDKDLAFSDGWEVVKKDNKLGIIWGYKKEFTPFEHFATRCTFTLGTNEKEGIIERG